MKRLIITESERKKILNMHGLKKMLSESTIVDVQNLLNTNLLVTNFIKLQTFYFLMIHRYM